ncbi:hypothetical protein LTR37_002101 [Vermiconidia calcicola]|uniref:Uncharacterized protein n=1 Tax=Vermiconidia calcicola TaxID=1690605 RepID=A0ACC3NWG6_9PEZI|nr:hypothetical protein LTR37_002101 [Vermiconidia calcicola]
MSRTAQLSTDEHYATHIQDLTDQAQEVLRYEDDLRKEMMEIHSLTENLLVNQALDNRPPEANNSIDIRQEVDALVRDDRRNVIANDISDVERHLKELKQQAKTLEEEGFIISQAPSTAERTLTVTEDRNLALNAGLQDKLGTLQSLFDNLQRQASRIENPGGRGGVVPGRVRSPKLFH